MKVYEYLSSKRAAGELLEKKYKKASKKFPFTTALFFILIAGLLFGATRFPQSTSEVISQGSFAEYERTSLGNAVINTLNNGIVADNESGYTEITGDGIRVIGKSGECLLPADASNINITEKGVFFRDNSNVVYSFLKYGESYEETGQVIIDEPCGNCMIKDNNLYVIRFSRDSHVYSFDLNGKNEKEVISEPVRAFVILDDSVFYLDYNNTLVKTDENGSKEYSLEKIDKFYLNGDLFIQNNDKVIKLNLNNENGTVVAEGIDELLGVTDSSIYYSKDNKVYEKEIDGSNEKVFSQGMNYYEGVYKNNGEVIAIGEEL
jgi:hypothetical protein